MTKTRTLNGSEVDTPTDAPIENGNGLFRKITKGRQVAPRRIMLYGVQGVGKSTWASMAPKPIFLPTEEGLNDLDVEAFPLLSNYTDFMSALRNLYSKPHDYKTVVVDSLDWLERMIWTDVCKEHGKADIADFGYGAGYKYALGYWGKVVEALSAIRSHRQAQIVLLAHCVIERFEAPDSDSYDRYTPKLHKMAAGLVMEWCDEVLFSCYETHVKMSEEKFNQERARGIGSGARIVRTTERPFARAKNRLGLPEEMPLDWREYASYLHNGTGKES